MKSKIASFPIAIMLLTTNASASVENIRQQSYKSGASINNGTPELPNGGTDEIVSDSLSHITSTNTSYISNNLDQIHTNAANIEVNRRNIAESSEAIKELGGRINELESNSSKDPSWVTLQTGKTTGVVHFPSNYAGQVQINGIVRTKGTTGVLGSATYGHTRCSMSVIQCSGEITDTHITGCTRTENVTSREYVHIGNGDYGCKNYKRTITVNGNLPEEIKVLVK